MLHPPAPQRLSPGEGHCPMFVNVAVFPLPPLPSCPRPVLSPPSPPFSLLSPLPPSSPLSPLSPSLSPLCSLSVLLSLSSSSPLLSPLSPLRFPLPSLLPGPSSLPPLPPTSQRPENTSTMKVFAWSAWSADSRAESCPREAESHVAPTTRHKAATPIRPPWSALRILDDPKRRAVD